MDIFFAFFKFSSNLVIYIISSENQNRFDLIKTYVIMSTNITGLRNRHFLQFISFIHKNSFIFIIIFLLRDVNNDTLNIETRDQFKAELLTSRVRKK